MIQKNLEVLQRVLRRLGDGDDLREKVFELVDRMEAQSKAEPCAFRWRKRGSTDVLDWRYCHDLKQLEDADVLKETETELVFTHADAGEVELMKAENEMLRNVTHSYGVQMKAIRQAVEEFRAGRSVFDGASTIRMIALGCMEEIEEILNTINPVPVQEKKE